MKYIELTGSSIKEDIKMIKSVIDGGNAVFVYSGPQTLYDYIDALYDKNKGLSAVYLYKFKVCYEKQNLDVTYSSQGGKRTRNIRSMSSLVNELDGRSKCRIVINNNDRAQLAFIVQQLIFIDYPLETVDILLKQEERDADKAKRFMKHVDELLSGCITAINRLNKLKERVSSEAEDALSTKRKRLEYIEDALNSCIAIKEQIDKSIQVELKLAVAASKKAGKSVIVNSFLGEQIAPTSTELATPNNCIYRRSPDRQYHLRVEGQAEQTYADREAVYDAINEYFRSAQNNSEQLFTCPDMHIDYVTDKNNFSSYTIFDTPGPDAAGTDHAKAAQEAMQKCDVAVFAIDYAKYLTTSEEAYLKDVKKMFSAQGKFHSLIFALNKIDVRYTDPDSPKSFIMSVDFLKKRLADIDEAYRDCIIFPTSSLEYFCAVVAEKAGVTELNAENNLPIGEMKAVKFAHSDVRALAWLHTHSENLEFYHGFQNISYDVFKKDSGMPALMSYVSYVAQSKARKEIVNSVAFKISSQKAKVQSVINNIVNIEALINADDEQISKITRIINNYADNVKAILSRDFSEDELKAIPQNALLRNFGGDYTKVIDAQKRAAAETCNEKTLIEIMYSAAVNKLWEKASKAEAITGDEMDNLFTKADFEAVANSTAEERMENAAQYTKGQLDKLSEEVKSIVERRQIRLKEESANCRKKLLKESIRLELPELPEFEFAAEMKPSSETPFTVQDVAFKLYDFSEFSNLFRTKVRGNVFTFFKKLFSLAEDKDYKRCLNVDKEKFDRVLREKDNPFLVKFENVCLKNKIADTLGGKLSESVGQYMKDAVGEIEQVFESMLSTYNSCVERFRSAVDDRDKYKDNIALHNRCKECIEAIDSGTREFMDVWKLIIQDYIDGESDNSAKEPLTV